MNFNEKLINQAQDFLTIALKKNIKLVTAESCTGGLLAALITSVSGSSKVFDSGFITYSNESKNTLLQVDQKLLQEFGAVSEEVARAMAYGALNHSNANLSLAITGIAGPNSDETSKKVGLVFIASLNKKTNQFLIKRFEFKGKRDEIRNSSVLAGLDLLIEQIN